MSDELEVPGPGQGPGEQVRASSDVLGKTVEGDGAALVAGTIPEIKKRVGDDPEKARAALAAETAEDGKNRDSLVAWLESVANNDES